MMVAFFFISRVFRYSILFIFYRSHHLQNILMQEAIEKRKHQEWMHLEQQYKNYKRNFHGRPIIPKQIPTYLELINFITQLVPAFNEHYFQGLTKQQNAFINQITQSISSDLQTKLKSLAYRLQKKEIEQNNSKDVKTLCKICLHQLRAAQIAEAKQSLDGKQLLTQNILRLIKEVEETSQPFSLEEDRRFFKQLKNALKNKQDVIQLCQSEGNQFINMIEEQLKGILIDKELLIFSQDKSSPQPQMKGYQLKQNVTKSLKIHINQKIPEIIKLVSANLKKIEEKRRKLRIVNTETQTIDAQNIKIIQFKRKISTLEQEISHINSQKNKLSWTIQEKSLIIDKYDKQLTELKEEFSKKTYELQKEVKVQQDKNKKYREQLQKQKSRRNIDLTENNFKSMNSFAQLKEPSFCEQVADEPQREQQRRQKRKKTINSFNKTNGKFILPTIKKISNDDQSIIKEDIIKLQTQQQSLEQPNASIDIRKSSNNITLVSSKKVSISRNNSKAEISSKQRNRSRKKGQRLMTLANAKDTINEVDIKTKSSYKTIKTERATQGTVYQQAQKETLPLIKGKKEKSSNIQKKSGNQIKRLNNSLKRRNDKIVTNHFKQNQSKIEEKVTERMQMQNEAYEVNQKLKQKALDRSNVNSSMSSKSNFKSANRTARQSIYKQKNKTEEHSQINESPAKDIYHQLFPKKRQSNTHKPYLRNSFSKINQQIDKQNYQTPMIEPQSVGVQSLKKLQENKSMKHHLFQIYREISKESKTHKDISIQKFSQIFEKYVSDLKIGKDNKKQDNQQYIVTAITEPFLPKLNQSILNAGITLKQNQGYCGVNRLKKQHQKQDIQTLKSRLQDQIGKVKSKQNSLNASYHASPSTKDDFQLSRVMRQRSTVNHKNSTLLTLEGLLFFNEEIAYRYETNFSKTKASASVPINPQIQEYLSSLYASLQQIKKKNPSYYNQISGFLRYPFSHSQNGFLQIDIIKSLSITTLTQCFLSLMTYHKKCEVHQSVCYHLINFKKKVQQFAEATFI